VTNDQDSRFKILTNVAFQINFHLKIMRLVNGKSSRLLSGSTNSTRSLIHKKLNWVCVNSRRKRLKISNKSVELKDTM